MYYIGTGRKYIAAKPDGYLFVTEDLDKAKKYYTAQRAGQALVSLPRKFYNISTQWAVRQDISEVEEESSTAIEAATPPSESDNTKEDNLSIDTLNSSETCDIDYLTLFGEMAKLKEKKNGCLTNLQSKLSEINEEITDIEHLIEFSKYNVSNAYAAYKMLRDTLQERRRIKDSIIAVKSLYENCNVNKIATDHSQLENRVYKPRRLTKLFD